MRKKLFICSALVSMAFLSANLAYSEDDVIVDLSVLGSLQNVSSPVPAAPQVKSQPLFPIVQKKASEPTTQKAVKKAQKKTAVKNKKKVQPKKEQVSEPVKIEKLTTKEKLKNKTEDALQENTAKQEKKLDNSKASQAPNKSKAECQQEKVNERMIAQPLSTDCQTQEDEATAKAKKQIEQKQATQKQLDQSVAKILPQKENETTPPEVVVTKVTELSKDKATLSAKEQVKTTSPKAAVDMLAPVDLTQKPKETTPPMVENTSVDEGLKPQPDKEVEKIVLPQKEDIKVPVIETQNNTSADMPSSKAQKISNNLLFAEGESDLTSAQEQQLDSILSNFKDAKNSKIAIVAYNLDNGTDTFLRKRNSLNRAVNIRSYLLKKGYKDYSIKVINVEDGDPRINTVNISERKK